MFNNIFLPKVILQAIFVSISFLCSTSVWAQKDLEISTDIGENGFSQPYHELIFEAKDEALKAITSNLAEQLVSGLGFNSQYESDSTELQFIYIQNFTYSGNDAQGTIGGYAFTTISNSFPGLGYIVYNAAGDYYPAGTEIPVDLYLVDGNGDEFPDQIHYTTSIVLAVPLGIPKPIINSVSIPNQPSKVGDEIAVTISADAAGYSLVTGQINGVDVTNFVDSGDGNYQATLTVVEGGTDVSASTDLAVNFTLKNSSDRTSDAYVAPISQDNDAIDANSPILNSVSFADQAYLVGDNISIAINAGEAGLSLITGTINGKAVTGFTDNNDGTYAAVYTVTEGDNDRGANEDIAVEFVLADPAGNHSNTFNTPASQANDAIDANSPVINSVSFADQAYKIGDDISIAINAEEAGLSLIAGTINGKAVTGFTDNNDGTYAAVYTVTEGDNDRGANEDIAVEFVLADPAGNQSNTFNTAVSQANDAIDANSPLFENSTPAVNQIFETLAVLDVDINEPSTVYYYVVNDGAIAPTITQIKNGQVRAERSSPIASGNNLLNIGDMTHSFTISGLSEGTDYDVYVLSEDLASNTTVVSLDITTLSNVAPELLSSVPIDNAQSVYLSQNLVLTFSETVSANNGSILIKNQSDNSVFETIDITDGDKVTFEGSVVTIDPTQNFSGGASYYLEIGNTVIKDLSGSFFSGITDSETYNFSSVNVVINEVVTDPQTDWSTNGFDGTNGGGTVSNVDEWIELYIGSPQINFENWTIELLDGTDIIGDLTANGAFDVSNYISSGTGTFNSSAVGDYLVLGNPDGAGAMNNTNLTINLKDPTGTVVDFIVLGSAGNEAPSGVASGLSNESVQRFANGRDTNTDNVDFTKGYASLAAPNSGPSVTLSQTTNLLSESEEVNTITAQLSATSAEPVTITLAIKDGNTATLNNDFTLSSTQIIVPAGSTTGSISLTSVDDALHEDNENLTIEITDVINGVEEDSQELSMSITDNDADQIPNVTLTLTGSPVQESDASVTITATLSQLSGKDVTVNLAVKEGGTASLNDFSFNNEQIVIAAGNLSASTEIYSQLDNLDEDNETAIIEIQSVTNGAEDTPQEVSFSIIDDDPSPVVSLSQLTNELSESGGTNTITAELSEVSGRPVTVLFGIKSGGTATLTNDFTLSATEIVIPAGSTTGTIVVTAVQDELDELDESFTIEVTSIVNGTQDGEEEEGMTITDDDDPPTVTLSQSTSNVTEAADVNTLTATLSAASSNDITVTIAIKSGSSASLAEDFTLSTTSIIIPAGNTAGTAIVTSVQDHLDEDDKSLSIEIVGVTNATEATPQEVTMTLLDDDDPPTVTLTQSSATLAEESATNTLTATLSALSARPVTVVIGVKSGSNATITEDFNLSTSSMVIPAGSTSVTATLTSIQDALDEDNETVVIEITELTNATEETPQEVTVTITDDDETPLIFLLSQSPNLPESETDFAINVILQAVSGRDVIVTLGVTAESTATLGEDFDLSTLTVTIPAGSISSDVLLSVLSDDLDEEIETIGIEVLNAVNAVETIPQQVDMAITDDDSPPTVTLSQSVSSFTEAAATNTLTATLSAISGKEVTVNLAVKSGSTATEVSDFNLSSTSLVIPAGSSTGTVTLTSVQDELDEENESVTIEITTVTNGTEDGTQEVAMTITDDDDPPTVTLTQSTSTLTEAPSTNTLTATLSTVSAKEVTVTLGVKSGSTAVLSEDFTQSSTTVVIPAGSTSGTVSLTTIEDALDEDNETITVEITSITNGIEDGSQEVTSTITDDDESPKVTLSQSTNTLVEAAAVNTIMASVSAISGRNVTIALAIKSGNSATVTTDFNLSTTSILIPAGSTTGTVTLTSVQDELDEENEALTVEIIDVTNGAEDGTQEVAMTITDDDDPPTITLSQSVSSLAEAAATNTLTATLSANSGKEVTVTLAVKSGSTATEVSDFGLSSTSLVIPAGSSTGTVTLTSVQDELDEENETVTIEITSVTNGTEDGTQEVAMTITDDDDPPTVTLTQSTTTLTEAPSTNTLTATLSTTSAKEVTVTLGVKSGSTAVLSEDFTQSSTTVVIPAGSTSGTVSLTTIEDVLDEDDETVTIEITGITNGVEDGAQEVTATITDDDALPTVTLSQSTSTFGEASEVNTLTVTLSAVSGREVTVNLGVKDGSSATNTEDYILSIPTVVIPAGSANGAVSLTTLQDVLDENDESITIEITNVTNAAEDGTQEVAMTIIDDDDPPTVTLTQEANSFSEAATNTITANLSTVSSKDVTISLAMKSGNTATLSDDFILSASTIVIPAGSLTGTVVANSLQDSLDEEDETLIIEITDVTNGTEDGIQEVNMTITDDDEPPTVSLSQSVNSLEEAETINIITATLSAVSSKSVTVSLGIKTGGTATISSDYILTSTEVVIPAGSLSSTVSLITLQDDLDEETETSTIEVISVVNGTEKDIQEVVATIIDDDEAPIVTLTHPENSLAEAGASSTLVATLSAISGKDVTVNLGMKDEGTANFSEDYTLTSTEVVIPAGSTTGIVSLTTLQDALDEEDETVIIEITSITNGTEDGVQEVTYSIIDDDDPPTVSMSQSANTIDENNSSIVLTIELATVSAKEVTVSLKVKATSEAEIGDDFTLNSTEVVVPAGSTSGTASLTTVQDALDETDESITIEISEVTNGTEDGVQEVSSTIIDDDAPPSVTFSQSTNTLAEALAINTITATLSEVSGKEVTLTVDVKDDGSATINEDFTLSSFTITIAAGSVTGTINLTTVQDDLDEENEFLTIEIESIVNATAESLQELSMTIIDDDDHTAPSGYSVAFDASLIGGEQASTSKFIFANAEIGSTYNYTVSSSGGGGEIAGTGLIVSPTDQILIPNLSDLPDGLLSLVVSLTDPSSNTGLAVEATTILDQTAPTKPVLESISLDGGEDQTDFITNDNTLVVQGNTEAGATAELFIANASIGSIIADENGVFSFDYSSTVLSDGVYSLTIQATDIAGNKSIMSDATLITVDTEAPSAPTVALASESDTGISNEDNITLDTTPTFIGTAEANSLVELFVDNVSAGRINAGGLGNWTLTSNSALADGVRSVALKVTDIAGNSSPTIELIELTIDTNIASPSLSPVNQTVDVLPNSGFTMSFSENVHKGIGNVTFRYKSDDSVLETLDVTSENITILGNEVSITPVLNFLPRNSELYINIDHGAFLDDAGNAFVGFESNTDWTFKVISLPLVSSVQPPTAGLFNIGDELEFILSFNQSVSVNGLTSIPLTIGEKTVLAQQEGNVENSNSITYQYVIKEGDLDSDGIELGTTIELNNGTIRDEYGADAVTDFNPQVDLTGVVIDGVKPVPVLSSTESGITNSSFSVSIEFDEPVTRFTVDDLQVTNGTAGNFINTIGGTQWVVDINPNEDGNVVVSIPENKLNDLAGNHNLEGNSISKEYDGTVPQVSSIVRKDAERLSTNTSATAFIVSFSEAVSGVDNGDFETQLSGTVQAEIGEITVLNGSTFEVTIVNISGEGTIGLNLKDNDSILDVANNLLGGPGEGNGDFTGQTYTTNFLPTDIHLSQKSISENNSKDEFIGDLSTSDVDTDDNHVYFLVEGQGSLDNGSFEVIGSSLHALQSFDFEIKNSYEIRIKTDDGHGGLFEKTFLITITNVQEPSIMISGDANFEATALGVSQEKKVLITNNGDMPVSISPSTVPQGFQIIPSTLNLDPDGNAEVTIIFTPTEVRSYSGNVVFGYEGIEAFLPVSGEGTIITSIDTPQMTSKDVTIYPNPASQFLILDLSQFEVDGVRVDIFDTKGNKVFEGKGLTKGLNRLEIGNIDQGLYILRITDGRFTIRKKILVKK